MASILKLFYDILCKLRSTRGFVYNLYRRWGFKLFLAFLGRALKLGEGLDFWRLWDDRKQGTFPKAERSRHPLVSPCAGTSLDLRDVVAASHIPASATRLESHPSFLYVSTATQQPQPATVSGAPPLAPVSLTVEPLRYRDGVSSSPVFDVRIDQIDPNRRSSDSSPIIRRRSSDRPSITQTYSRESLSAPVSQPTQFPRAPHRHFGRGPSRSLSRSRESSRSPSPTPQSPRFETEVTDSQPQTQVVRRNGSVKFPTVTSHGHGLRRRQSSTASVVVEVVNPSTDSLPAPFKFFPDGPPLTDEPYSIDSPIGHLSVVDTVDLREGLPQLEHNFTASPFSATSNFEPPVGCFLKTITSEQVSRYTKDVTVPRESTYYEIPPLTRSFPHISHQIGSEQAHLEDCAPWVPATHPDGALYFFDQDRKLFTESDMFDSLVREEMEEFYHYMQKLKILRHDGVAILSQSCDLVLDITRVEDDRVEWSYYYACHETRCLFWLDSYDATHMISELFGVKSPAHIRHRLESLYWTHWSLFPAVFEGRRLDRAVVDELAGILSYGCIDVMTSKFSTLPFDNDTMQKMLALVQNPKESDAGLVYQTAGVTRLLSCFAHWRFLCFHGQNNARLERHKTAYANAKQKRSLLITSLSPALFLAPENYLRELENVWVDEVIIEVTWRNFISGLLKEWEQLILASTVVLSVNVGFLAIPGVVISNLNTNITNPNQVNIFTSPAQIASCMSIVASAGSIMIGLLLIRHSGPKQNEDPAGASDYLYRNTHRTSGLERLAIIFSLPWALLMWSMVTFFIALLLFCFCISNASTRIFVAVTSVVVAALVAWCIQNIWGSSDATEAWFSGLLPSITRRLDNARAACHRILALIDFRSFWDSPSVSLDRPGSVRSRPYPEGVSTGV